MIFYNKFFIRIDWYISGLFLYITAKRIFFSFDMFVSVLIIPENTV